MTYYLGVDPGEHGSAALVGKRGVIGPFIRFHGRSEREIADWFGSIKDIVVEAAVEKVWAWPNMGNGGAFNFGWNFGLARMAVIANGIDPIDVLPHKWQSALGIPSCDLAKETKQEFKKRIRRFAQERWPKAASTIHLELADSLLIADWLRLKTMGKVK